MHTRPSWDEYFFDIAKLVSTRATCLRASCGAVVVRDNRILSTGFNGSPPGEPHCLDEGCIIEDSHCVVGDTLISKWQPKQYNSKHRTVKEIYDLSRGRFRWMVGRMLIRGMDDRGYVCPEKITDVWKVGERPVYEVTTFLGRRIETTEDHRFWTPKGWMELGGLSEGLYVGLNGNALHDNPSWLRKQYEWLGKTQLEIAGMCGVARSTIKKRLQKFGIEIRPFSFGGWNKGLRGRQLPYYKGRNVLPSSSRGRSKWRNRSFCEICFETGDVQTHHKDFDPINDDEANLLDLCVRCHMIAHTPHAKTEKVKFDQIVSIRPKGVKEVFDLETTQTHTFVGNGFILHNCQRCIHAETNAIAQAAITGTSISGSTIYIYGSNGRSKPCRECMKVIKAAHIAEIKCFEPNEEIYSYLPPQQDL